MLFVEIIYKTENQEIIKQKDRYKPAFFQYFLIE
jgi:hypothetical protein